MTENTCAAEKRTVIEAEEAEQFAELQRVRLHRVYADPVITHCENIDWGLADSDGLIDHIITARMKRLRTAPADVPIEHATLPEAVAYLASASMDAGAATGTVPALYHLAMREYVEEYDVEGPEWLVEELKDEEYHHSRLADLQREIKQAQDRAFLADGFDDLGTQRLQKAFWTKNTGVTTSGEGTAENY